MTQEDKQLLLIDLCARLPYGVNAEIVDMFGYTGKIHISVDTLPALDKSILLRCKPYLRPMSSMTENERFEYLKFIIDETDDEVRFLNKMVFYNKYHFDYRGLIEKGLAIEASEDMYKID